MDGVSRIFCIALAVLCVCQKGKATLFGKGKETVYSYSTDVRAGAHEEVSFVSQFGLTSTLTITTNKDGNSAIFQLSNISMQLFNGELSLEEDTEAKFLPMSVESLETPFEVTYSDGLVKSIFTNKNEEIWTTNMKKSIAGILQLDLKNIHFDKSHTFPTRENTIYGNCFVEYNVRSKEGGYATIRKMPSHFGCQGPRVYNFWGNPVGTPCSQDARNTIDVGSERVFEVDSSDDNLSINKVSTRGHVYFAPYPNVGFSQHIQVKQTFQLENQHLSTKYKSNQEFKEQDMSFTLTGFDEKSGTRFSLSGEKDLPSQETLVSMVLKQLHELVQNVEEIRFGGVNDQNGYLEENKNERSQLLSLQLIRTLGFLNYDSLKNFYSEIGVGTSSTEESIRDLFLDLLSQTGTKAAIMLLQDLITNNVLIRETSIQILKTTPFYLRQTGESILKIYERVLDVQDDEQIRRAATLSFGTMVDRACKNDQCSPEVIDKYILKYLELFKGATDYQWKMTYLEGLGNMRIGNVVKYLEPIIKGDQSYSHHIRFLAIWATYLTSIRDPDRVSEIYWPILENKSEHLELRMGAFTVLLLSKPIPERFHALAALMEEEPEGSHLYYFFYSTIQSLAGTTHPCYQGMKKIAQHILRYARLPEKEPLWTGNHMFDYIDDNFKFGSFLQLVMLADQQTGGPNIFFFSQNEHFSGSSHQLLAFYIKMQGVKRQFRETLVKENDMITKLQLLLSSIGVKQIKEDDEDMHFELLVQSQDKTVMAYYFNESNIEELVKTLKSMDSGIKSDFHMNYQGLLFSIINELTGPTDMGVPMTLTIPIPILFSLSGNFTHDTTETSITRKNEIDMKYWKHGGSFLTVYNPIGKLWHGVSRLHTVLLHVPLNIDLTAQFAGESLVLALSKMENAVPGVAVHAGSNVFTMPIFSVDDDSHKTLLDSCSTCLPDIPLRAEDYHEKQNSENEELGTTGLHYIFRYFDCDISNMPFIIEEATDGMTSNYNERYQGSGEIGLLVLQHLGAIAHLPVSGRCGFVAKIALNTDSNISRLIAVMNFTDYYKKDTFIKGYLSKEMLSGASEQLYSFSYNLHSEESHHSLQFKFTSNSLETGKLKMCVDGDIYFPDPPIDPLKQRTPEEEEVRGSLNAVIGLARHNTCPKSGIVFKIKGRAIPVPDKNYESYKICSEEGELEEWTQEISVMQPSTPSCFQAAVDSTELRKFEFSYEVTSFLSDLASKSLYALYVEDGTDPWGEYIVPSNYSLDDYPIIKDGNGFVVELPRKGFLLVDTFEDGERERVVFDYAISSPFNSRFPLHTLAAHEENVFAFCAVTASSVWTLDKSNLPHSMATCYTLIVGDCHTLKPKFAVLARRIEGTQDLAIKIQFSSDIIEIIPGPERSLEVNVDGQPYFVNKDNDFEIPEVGPMRIRMTGKENNGTYHFQLKINDIDFEMVYTTARIVLQMSSFFNDEICGLCGNFNNKPSHTKWDSCKDA